MKNIMFVCTLVMVCMFVGIATAENEGTFDPTTGQLHIPKVSVGSDYYTVDMQHTTGLNFTISNAAPTSPSEETSIIGSWGVGYYAQGIENEGEPEYITLTFYPNGYYIHYETGQQSEPCDNGGGVEYGTYTYDPQTELLTSYPIVDENGCVGLSDYGQVGQDKMKVVNDILIIYEDDGSIEFTVERVK